MAKVPFSKFNLKVCSDTIPAKFGEIEFEVKAYLPIEEKQALITKILDWMTAVSPLYEDPMAEEIYTDIALIEGYTNITFTEKQKENMPKLYDMINCGELMQTIWAAIPDDEAAEIGQFITCAIKNYYDYRKSVYAILDSLKNDYGELNLDATAIQEKLNSGEGLETVKAVLDKLD